MLEVSLTAKRIATRVVTARNGCRMAGTLANACEITFLARVQDCNCLGRSTSIVWFVAGTIAPDALRTDLTSLL